MKVELILPALTEATSPQFRPIKYSLFPPLGLATLAAYLDTDDEVTLCDEHVEKLDLNDCPDLVVVQVYITSARRSYRIADHYRAHGAFVVLGGLHVTSLPDEAARHADAIFLGPGEDTWPQFLRDFRAGRPARRYESCMRTLHGMPPARRDLIKRHLYLVPNSIVVSRGCPNRASAASLAEDPHLLAVALVDIEIEFLQEFEILVFAEPGVNADLSQVNAAFLQLFRHAGREYACQRQPGTRKGKRHPYVHLLAARLVDLNAQEARPASGVLL